MPGQPVNERALGAERRAPSAGVNACAGGDAGLRDPIIVLKFGGSVLGQDQDAARATHEVYRWVRQGYRVVAVVSAFEGQTDRLLLRASAWEPGSAGELTEAAASATAALVATGEQSSAAVLGLALDRAGIPAEVLDPAAIGLRTAGPALDATPIGLDAEAILAALARVPAIVVPGFTGREENGRVTLLGRGGSDLSALFIAQRLESAVGQTIGDTDPPPSSRGASPTPPARAGEGGRAALRIRCRLVKDVDGLYDRDPAIPGPSARRYASLSWDDALALDGTIVQHKGVRFAREHGLCFEVAALLGARASRVGAEPARFDDAGDGGEVSGGGMRVAGRPPGFQRGLGPVPRVTILGAGVVGGGVYQALRGLPEWFEVVCVAARDLAKAEARGIPRELLTSDLDEALDRESDIVVELLGGMEPAQTLVRRALGSGRGVVTANKAIVADLACDLPFVAACSGSPLLFSAAVGGAVACLETARRLARADGVVWFEGLLNGTTNFVLGRVEAGQGFEDAVRAAQAAGFAEADPSRDLDGRDAADKLALLVRAALGVRLDPDEVERVGLDASACSGAAPRIGLVLKHVARAERVGDGVARASVRPEWVERSGTLGRTRNEENAVVFVTMPGRRVAVHGKGAGRWPTTEAVVADLLDLARARLTGARDGLAGGASRGASETTCDIEQNLAEVSNGQ